MSQEDNKALLKRFYEEIVSTGNVDHIEELVAPDCVEVQDGERYSVGIEGMKAHILGVRQTYPDLKIIVERQLAEGEWVASCIVARGTHEGRWLDIEPTHESVSFTGVNVDRIVGGRMVEHGGAANMLGPLLEIGAIRIVGRNG